MKCTVIHHEGAAQVNLLPETDAERATVALIKEYGSADAVNISRGGFGRSENGGGMHFGFCQGGWLQCWESPDALMLTLRKKGVPVR